MKKKNSEPQLTPSYKINFKNNIQPHIIYLLIFLFLFIAIQDYVFNKKVDHNGDNATYYIGAMSLYQGNGYANILLPEKPKTNVFPPGYPFLMSLMMQFSSSFIAQKILNVILLGLSCILLYLILYQNTRDKLLSLLIALLPTLNHSILQFSTKMLSEPSYLFFSTFAVLALFKLKDSKSFKQIFKDPYFYILIFTSAYAYHIRTQGISLVGAIGVFFLLSKNWKLLLSYSGGFVLSALPWIIRNKIEQVPASRYLEKVLAVNHWRPDEGFMSVSEMALRMLKTSKMLVTQAIPDSIIPNYIVNYKEEVTLSMWFIGLIIIPLIIFGYWRFFKHKAWFFILYIIFNCIIISLWSAPSRNRYLVGLIPFIQAGLVLGIIGTFELLFHSILKFKIDRRIFVSALILFSIFAIAKDVRLVEKENSNKMHPAYKNFYTIAQSVKKKHPKGNVTVCSRKPSLFYLYSHCFNTAYKSSTNDTVIIEDLIKKDVDYVVIEQLGYSSTHRYLYPAIQKNQNLFRTVMHLKNPDTYLLWFDKKKAKLRYQ